MGHPRYSSEEFARRGQAIYEGDLRGKVEADNKGRYLVIDIETGDYAIADDYLSPSERMLASRPEAALYVIRIGYPTVGRIGGPRRIVKQ